MLLKIRKNAHLLMGILLLLLSTLGFMIFLRGTVSGQVGLSGITNELVDPTMVTNYDASGNAIRNVGYMVVGVGDFGGSFASDELLLAFTSQTSSITLTIEHAGICQTRTPGSASSVDAPNNGSSPNTLFAFYNLKETSIVPSRSFIADRGDCQTSGNQSDLNGNTINKTVTVSNLTRFTDRVTGNDYYGGGLYVKLNSGGSRSQQNSFKVIASRSTDRVGYDEEVADFVRDRRRLPADLTFSVTNTDLPREATSNYKLPISLSCETTAVQRGSITFYDVDDRIGVASTGGAAWQNINGYNGVGNYNFPRLTFELWRKSRGSTSGFTKIMGPIHLSGGNGVADNSVGDITLERNYDYEFRVNGLSRPNAIQFGTTGFQFSQVQNNQGCANPAPIECDISYPSAIPAGDRFNLDLTITNTSGKSLVFERNSTARRAGIGLIDPSGTFATQAQYGQFSPGDSSRPTPDTGTRWRQIGARSGTGFDSFTDPRDGQSKRRISKSSNTTVGVNQTVRFNITLQAPNSPGNYPIGFRLLDRDVASTGLPWIPLIPGDGCTDTINIIDPNQPPEFTSSSGISVSCSVNTGQTTAVLRVTFSARDTDGDAITATASGAINDSRTGSSSSGTSTLSGEFTRTVTRRAAAYAVTVVISDGTDSNSDSGSATCSLPAPPTVSIIASGTDCNQLSFRITDTEGFRYNTELQANNSNASPRVRQNNLSTNPSPADPYVFNEVAEWKDFNSRNFRVRATNTSFSGVSRNSSNVRLGPCITIACSNFDVAGVPEVNTEFTATFSFTQSEAIGSRGNDNRDAEVTLTMEPVITNGVGLMHQDPDDSSTTDISTNYPTRTVYKNGLIATEPGDFVADISITGLNPNPLEGVDCGNATAGGGFGFSIANRPYVKVYGNDVFAGGGFKNDAQVCEPLSTAATVRSAVAYSSVKEGDTFFVGSSSELAVFAVDTIRGIRPGDAQRPTITNAGDPTSALTSELTRLAFANTGSALAIDTATPDALNLGGGFGQTLCSTNWWLARQGDPKPSGVAASNIFNLASSDYDGEDSYFLMDSDAVSPLRISASGPIENGTNITLYVDGDVIITDDIVFDNDSWTDADDIPSVYIVTLGNIYIEPDVEKIQGSFIAQPDITDATTLSNTGEIHTCYDSSSGGIGDLVRSWSAADTNASSIFLAGECDTKLVVEGAFVAKRVELLRTNGTVSDAEDEENTEYADSSDGSGGPFDQTNQNIAEVFRFNPLLYLGDGEGKPKPPTLELAPVYESILSLPPNF